MKLPPGFKNASAMKTGERLVTELRTDDGSIPAFAVGFVSVLAGTLLAAELLKLLAGASCPLSEDANRAVFQFQRPAAETNRAQFYSRDDRCNACSPANQGTRVWKRRYEKFMATE